MCAFLLVWIFLFIYYIKEMENNRMMMYCLRNLCVSCSIICSLLFHAKIVCMCGVSCVSECVFVFVYRYKWYFPTGTYVHSHSHITKICLATVSYLVFISALISAVNIIHIVRRENNRRSRNSIVFFIWCCLFTFSLSLLHFLVFLFYIINF